MEISKLDTTNECSLFLQYRGQHNPQKVYVELDCENETLSVATDGEIGNGVPFRVYHDLARRWYFNGCPTASGANEFLDSIAEQAEKILEGYTCEWDGNNHRGRFDDDARNASQAIEFSVEQYSGASVEVWDAADWYAAEGDRHLADRLGITAETTDEAIASMVEAESAELYEYQRIDNVSEYLTKVRDELIEE